MRLFFGIDPWPSSEQYAELALTLMIPHYAVVNWFQNARENHRTDLVRHLFVHPHRSHHSRIVFCHAEVLLVNTEYLGGREAAPSRAVE